MDEIQKPRVLVAILAFAWTAMAYQMIFNTGLTFTYGKLGLAIVLGAVVGGIAYVATMLTQK
jgi:hypothetical protein